jgi:hypothetical protein
MAARLKLCLMSHIEDLYGWDDATSRGTGGDPWAVRLGTLAHAIATGGRGGKLSVQADFGWLDQNAGADAYPGGPTSLRPVLTNGGNFWVHNHSATYNHLQSTWMTVASAYASEVPGGPVAMSVATPETAGRSGGSDLNDSGLDWVSIAVAAGIKRYNSTVVNYSSCTPESLRPYRMSVNDMKQGAWFHDAAPGPLYDGAPTTMRQRPFWVNSASQWDFQTASTFPQEATVGSLLMIPNPGRFHLGGLAEGRGAYSGDPDSTITPQDLEAALTEVWSTYKQMEDYQGSISNVWYVHVQPGLLKAGAEGVADVVNTIGAWVDSVNAMLNVPNSAVWMNMNEIASCYANPTSAFW